MRITHTFLLVFLVCLAGCAGSKEIKREEMALGWVDRSVFDTPVFPAFKTTYDTVNVNADFLELIRHVNSGVDALVFFGTWCGDSKREVPRFLKIADQTGMPSHRIALYGLDRSKKSSDGLTEKYQIQLVPTIIFLKDSVELGRIIERPKGTIEEDMLTILVESQKK